MSAPGGPRTKRWPTAPATCVAAVVGLAFISSALISHAASSAAPPARLIPTPQLAIKATGRGGVAPAPPAPKTITAPVTLVATGARVDLTPKSVMAVTTIVAIGVRIDTTPKTIQVTTVLEATGPRP